MVASSFNFYKISILFNIKIKPNIKYLIVRDLLAATKPSLRLGLSTFSFRLAAPSSPIGSSLSILGYRPTLYHIVLFHRLSYITYAQLACPLPYTLAICLTLIILFYF